MTNENNTEPDTGPNMEFEKGLMNAAQRAAGQEPSYKSDTSEMRQFGEDLYNSMSEIKKMRLEAGWAESGIGYQNNRLERGLVNVDLSGRRAREFSWKKPDGNTYNLPGTFHYAEVIDPEVGDARQMTAKELEGFTYELRKRLSYFDRSVPGCLMLLVSILLPSRRRKLTRLKGNILEDLAEYEKEALERIKSQP